MEIASLEGFLFKKSHKDNSLVSLLKKDVKKRWFKVMETSGFEGTELALCYFESDKDKNAKSWIYLKDVTDISEDKDNTFTVSSKSRFMTLYAATRAEQRLWLQGLVNICHFADCSRIMSSDIVVPPRILSKIKYDAKHGDEKEVKKSYNDLLSIDKAEGKEDNENKKSKSPHRTKLSDIQLEINGPKVSQIEKLIDKDDHRLHGYRNTGAGATSRLHGHIRKEQNADTAVNRNSTAIKSKVVLDCSGPSTINNRVLAHIEHKNSQNTDDQEIEDVDLNAVSSDKTISSKYNRSNREKYLKNKQKKNDESSVIDDDDSSGGSDQEDSSTTNNDVDMNAESKVDVVQIAPKIRRARDTLDEKDSNDGIRKPTIDDLLNTADNDHSFEIDENAIDFKAERENRKSNSVSNADSSGLSKPPRPPPNVSKPPYAQKTKVQTSGSINIPTSNSNRPSTPARAAGNPGVVMDTNFVSENWDDDIDAVTNSNFDPTSVQVKKVPISGQVGKDAGVRSDDNWLEDDFDDD